MSNFSLNFRYFLFLLSLLWIKYSFVVNCEPPDRTYSCNCVTNANRSIFMQKNGQYNAPVENFVPALKSLQYCTGSFFCKPDFKQNQPPEVMPTYNYLVCFSDISCLSAYTHVMPAGNNPGDTCAARCMPLENLLTMDITNDVLESGKYQCVKVGPEGIKPQYCLNIACHAFTAVEKLCDCNYKNKNCSCSSFCQNLHTSVSQKTYALFLSFEDVFVMTGAQVNYLQYFILTVLCIGSLIIVIVFCNFYITVDRLSHCNEAQNTEALRRILTATLDPSPPPLPPLVKDDTGVDGCRGSPPPTYEQVLKDKCVEFKKSMA